MPRYEGASQANESRHQPRWLRKEAHLLRDRTSCGKIFDHRRPYEPVVPVVQRQVVTCGNYRAQWQYRVPDDPVLGPVFAHMPADHFETVAHFVSEVLGGPKLYSGNGQRGHSTMVGEHLNRHLTQSQRRRWMTLLLETADDLKLPEDPEFRSALVGYLEWGSRLAVLNSNTADNPIDPAAAMPRWGWGEVKGPYAPD